MFQMRDGMHSLALYLHLARASSLRRQPLVTDKLLVLSGAMAWELKLPEVADRCHAAVLSRNPRHLLRHWTSFAQAESDERYHNLLRLLRRQYSPEKAEHMLGSLGIEMARESELYETPQEYATALLDAVLGNSSPA